MVKYILKEIVKWTAAVVLSFLIVDIVIMTYFKSSGFIKRDTNATDAIWYPNSMIIYGQEGYGVNVTDKNGYVNDSADLADNYILVMGSSQTEGLRVKSNEKYTSIMNNSLKDDDKVVVYNIARSGRKWNDIVTGFNAALQEFPNTEIVIVEVSKTKITPECLKNSLITREYSGKDVGWELVDELNINEKLKLFAERNLSLLYLIYDIQLKKLIDPAQEQEEKFGMVEYEEQLDKTMKMLRNDFEGPIIVCYLPKVEIEDKLQMVYEDTTETFKECCEKNNIIFVDPGDAFLDAYNKNFIVPYGFWNTSMGNGHLNIYGNKILAEVLLDKINELENKGNDDK